MEADDDQNSRSADRNSEAPSDLSARDESDEEEKSPMWTFLRMNCPSVLEDLTTHMNEDNSLLTYRSLARMISKAVGSQDLMRRMPVSADARFYCIIVEEYEEIPANESSILMVKVKEFACVDDSIRQNKIKGPLRLLLSPGNKLRRVFRLLVKTGDLAVIWGGVRCDLENETVINLNPEVCSDIVVVSLSLKENADGSFKEAKRVMKIAEMLDLNRELIKYSENIEFSDSIRLEQINMTRQSAAAVARLVKTEDNQPVKILAANGEEVEAKSKRRKVN